MSNHVVEMTVEPLLNRIMDANEEAVMHLKHGEKLVRLTKALEEALRIAESIDESDLS